MVMMVTVALMMGEMGAVAERVGLDDSQSRGPGFETHPALFRILDKFVYHTLPKLSRYVQKGSQ